MENATALVAEDGDNRDRVEAVVGFLSQGSTFSSFV